MFRTLSLALLFALNAPSAVALAQQVPSATVPAADFAADAEAIDRLLVENYAYLDRFADGQLPQSPQLAALRAGVSDRDSLLAYAELRLHTLADHHASTGSAFDDSWALVPTYSDLWIERQYDHYVVTAVRHGSVAASAGVAAGDRLVSVGDDSIAVAIAAFWAPAGLDDAGDRGAYAARVLAAGRRDRTRDLGFARGDIVRRLTLASLYGGGGAASPVSASLNGDGFTIRLNNSLGDPATIAAFDAAMAALPGNAAVEIDLTETPSGGNTTIARAIMGWFVQQPTSYQVHNWPAEMRSTGIERQWIEQVLPRAGKYHHGPVSVRVGRWTGSMGEGLAIGFGALRARVHGDRMAGLLGAIYNFTLPASGLRISFPAERLTTVDGVPRERYIPGPCVCRRQQSQDIVQRPQHPPDFFP